MKETSAIAKLTRPRAHGALPRERLFAQLDGPGAAPVTWVSGAPGAGKTTLAATWIETRDVASCWYRLDQRDADPATLFYYLGEAARSLLHQAERPVPLFAPEYSQGLPAFAHRFFESLFACLPRPFVLVFDDYHDLPPDSLTHAALQHGLAELPAGVKVLILGRNEPPPEFARFRVAGEMDAIPARTLRLNDDEVDGIVRRRGVADASRIRALAERAQGWAAGLQLLLEALGDDAASHDDAAPEVLFQYFAGEVFRLLTEGERRVLMAAALLPSCTAALAAELADEPMAAALLEQFYRRNYFVTRDDADETAQYRLHPLFRDFLRNQARQRFSREERARLRVRAAEWLAARGKFEDAVALRQAAHDDAGVAALVIIAARELLDQGRHRTVTAWIAALPAELIAAKPWLLYWQGMAQLPFSPKAAKPIFEAAFARFLDAGEVTGIYLAWAAAVQSIRLDHTCDYRQLDDWLVILDALQLRFPDFPSEDVEFRVAHQAFPSFHYRAPLKPQYEHWRARVLALAEGRSQIEQTLAFSSAIILGIQGGLGKELATLCSRALPPGDPKLTPFAALTAYLAETMHHYYRGQFAGALKTADEARALSIYSGVSAWNVYIAGLGVSAALASKDPEGAEQRIAAMSRDGNWSGAQAACFHDAQALAAYHRGDFDAALHCAEESIAAVRHVGWAWHETRSLVIAALIAVETRQPGQADRYLEGIRTNLAQGHCLIFEFPARLAAVRLAMRLGDPQAGVELLRSALAFGRSRDYLESGFVRTDVLGLLCAQALSLGIEPDFARHLIRLRQLEAPAGSEDVWPIAIRVRTLGSFEILLDDAPLAFPGKAPRKPLELLQAVVAFGGREVPAETLCTALWPDAEGDAAATSLRVTLSRLRKLLGHDEAVGFAHGKLCLDAHICRTDVADLERLLDRIAATAPGDADRLADRLLQCYRGGFLEREREQAWMLPLRERLRRRFIAAVGTLGQRLEDAGAHDKAIALYRRALDQDNVAEAIYRRLIHAHRILGQDAEAVSVFRRCREMLSIVLRVAPAAETLAAVERLQH